MANPLLKDGVFDKANAANTFNDVINRQGTMTVSGTINKSLLLVSLIIVSAIFAWNNPAVSFQLVWPALIFAFILAIVCVFKKEATPYLSPVYAVLEGFVLGAVSLVFERYYPGIVINAVLLTVCILFCMLAAYRAGLLKASPTFVRVVVFSTLAIAIVYLLGLILPMFGVTGIAAIHSTSLGGWGILLSVFIVIIASLNLIIDFDLIARGSRSGAPKYMEWYGAFALMITLVWLYLEVLRLLARTRE